MYADMHAEHCTARGPGCQTSGRRLPLALGELALELGKRAPTHLCTRKLPSRSPEVGHHGDVLLPGPIWSG